MSHPRACEVLDLVMWCVYTRALAEGFGEHNDLGLPEIAVATSLSWQKSISCLERQVH